MANSKKQSVQERFEAGQISYIDSCLEEAKEYKQKLQKENYLFYPTTHNWRPSFSDNLAAVKIVKRKLKKPFEYAVVVTGANPLYWMEFVTSDKEIAEKVLKDLPKVITQEYLLSIGFESGL